MDLSRLKALGAPRPVTTLDNEQAKELQSALASLGYPIGAVDGIIGPRTLSAWAEFKTDVHTGNPSMIGPGSVSTLVAKTQMPSYNFSSRAATISAIKSECIRQGIGLDTQVAYVLATVQWETAKQFKPVREAFWLSEQWREANLPYYPYYGRGFVQLTWKNNYEYYAKILEIDLVNTPDLALEPQYALFILVHGFKTGAFTGRAITDYINAQRNDFIDARRCINGTDRATEIAAIADDYLHGNIAIA